MDERDEERTYSLDYWFKDARIRQLPESRLTVPSKWRQSIVCTDQCDTCPMYLKGCAKRCSRFPDAVCATCPCRASIMAGNINGVSEIKEG